MESENQPLNETQEPAQTAATEPASADDWKSVLPEDLRGAKEFEGIDGVETMARHFVAQKRAAGGDFVPATEEQAVEYFKRAGAPDTIDGYERLTDVPEDNKEMRALEDTLLHGALTAHLTKNQYAQMRDALFEKWKGEYEAQAKIEEAERLNAQKALRSEFGAAFESKMGDFAYVTELAGLKEWAEKNGAANDPAFIRAMLKIGEKYIEPTGAPIGNGHVTTAGLKAEINALMASPAYMDKNHPQHNDVVNQAFLLRKKINGEV